MLAVASVNYWGYTHEMFDWAAYIDAVLGENHKEEHQQVARTGTKLSVKVAHILFPYLPVERWRD